MLKINSVEFFTSFVDPAKMPETDNVEMAFVGRSNVGKSSLINNLTNKKIAKTSSTPGKTQLINLFLINQSFYFVDLPGYGYAKVAISTKKKWQSMMETYLINRKQLKVIFFLLDIRRMPNQEDKTLNEWFKKAPEIKILYILTKADKMSAMNRKKQKTKIALDLFADQADFIYYSTTKKIGRVEVLKKLTEFLIEQG